MKHEYDLQRHGLFDAKVPRFTSYPPATAFSNAVGPVDGYLWRRQTDAGTPISLYVHIPFCRHICWFCACRTQGLKSDAPLAKYVDRVLTEARKVRADFPDDLPVQRLHLGGGTPTILPPALLDQLLAGLEDIFDLSRLEEFSVEIDPTDVDLPRAEVLVKHGMTRASFGIQDFDPQVQDAIGRPQGADLTRDVVAMVRSLGVDNINFDLLYGLPFQTDATLQKTLDQSLAMDPDRLALFGYAHVPWVSKRQIMIDETALPGPKKRFALFQRAQKTFLQNSYRQIGIDHFAKPTDGLAHALSEGRLHRSFQGYTDDSATHLVALGASGISKYPQGYTQNNPSTGAYSLSVDAGVSPVSKGVALSADDTGAAAFVEALLCYAKAPLADAPQFIKDAVYDPAFAYADAVEISNGTLSLHRWAQPLVRIIAAALTQTAAKRDVQFSQAI